jgi:hypothetical protein
MMRLATSKNLGAATHGIVYACQFNHKWLNGIPGFTKLMN